MRKNAVKIIFIIRVVLWTVALGATIYWIRYSFKLYEMGIHDVYEYASYFRPVFSTALFITIIDLLICYILRSISDKLKNIDKYGHDILEDDK